MNNTNYLNNIPIFFIIGKGRSGTTLLQTLLDAHPNICIPLESRFFIHLYKKYHSKIKWSRNDLTQFYHDLLTEEKISLIWNINLPKLKSAIENSKSDISFAELCKLIYAHYDSFFKKSEIQLIGDKNPVNTLFLDWILSVYPNAKFIHMLRDPRANVASHIKAHPDKSIAFSALKVTKYNERCETFKTKIKQQTLTLYYEKLVANPKTELDRICKFLNIEFNESMLNHSSVVSQNIKEQLTTNVTNDKNIALKLKIFNLFHKNLEKPINTNSINKWKEEFSHSQVNTIESLAKKDHIKYGYDLVNINPEISFLTTLIKKVYYIKWEWQMLLYFNLPLKIRIKIGRRNNYLEKKINKL
jgi:hypothetical protein